jgi:hypothetical protein
MAAVWLGTSLQRDGAPSTAVFNLCRFFLSPLLDQGRTSLLSNERVLLHVASCSSGTTSHSHSGFGYTWELKLVPRAGGTA